MSLGKCFCVCWAPVSCALGPSFFHNHVAWAVQIFLFFSRFFLGDLSCFTLSLVKQDPTTTFNFWVMLHHLTLTAYKSGFLGVP